MLGMFCKTSPYRKYKNTNENTKNAWKCEYHISRLKFTLKKKKKKKKTQKI